MQQNNLVLKILIGIIVALVVACLVLFDKLNDADNKRLKDIRTERQVSEIRFDSIKKVMKLNTIAHQEELDYYKKLADTLNQLYNESIINTKNAKAAIRADLNKPLSSRFAKFKKHLSSDN